MASSPEGLLLEWRAAAMAARTRLLCDVVEEVAHARLTQEELMYRTLADQLGEALRAQSAAKPVDDPTPIPMRLECPACGELHVDWEFANRPHHTHACLECGMVWRPAIVNTVGVRFLPGFKNSDPTVA